jgi:methylenetetrahydrofolate reductase (NADPH)
MNANVAGIHVPDDLIDIMAKASKEDREKVGLEMAANLIRKMKDMCQGVHIMAVAWEKKVPEIMALAGL